MEKLKNLHRTRQPREGAGAREEFIRARACALVQSRPEESIPDPRASGKNAGRTMQVSDRGGGGPPRNADVRTASERDWTCIYTYTRCRSRHDSALHCVCVCVDCEGRTVRSVLEIACGFLQNDR